MFKTLEEIKEYLSHEKIECLECGKSFLALTSHLAKVHDMSCYEYKEKYGIPYRYGLCGVSSRKKRSLDAHKKRKEGKLLIMTSEMAKEIAKTRRPIIAPCAIKCMKEHGILNVKTVLKNPEVEKKRKEAVIKYSKSEESRSNKKDKWREYKEWRERNKDKL